MNSKRHAIELGVLGAGATVLTGLGLKLAASVREEDRRLNAMETAGERAPRDAETALAQFNTDMNAVRLAMEKWASHFAVRDSPVNVDVLKGIKVHQGSTIYVYGNSEAYVIVGEHVNNALFAQSFAPNKDFSYHRPDVDYVDETSASKNVSITVVKVTRDETRKSSVNAFLHSLKWMRFQLDGGSRLFQNNDKPVPSSSR